MAEQTELGVAPGDIDVSVVIVSWNVAELLVEAIQSLQDHSDGLKIEIIVVDNNSTDNTLEMVRKRFPLVRVIANHSNVGFSRANNQGITMATGRHVLILNPDTRVTPGALQSLAGFLDSHGQAGMVGPRLVCDDQTLQKTCARLDCSLMGYLADGLRLTKLPKIGVFLQRKLKYPYDYDQSQAVEAISGAAMLVRRELLDELQGFGETFVHTGEDLDLCYRLRQTGDSIHYLAEATIIHHGGKSSSQVPLQIYVNSLLSKQQYFVRNRGYLQGLLFRIIISIFEIPANLVISLFGFITGKISRQLLFERLRTAVCAWRWRWIDSGRAG